MKRNFKTEEKIEKVKSTFEKELRIKLGLTKVVAPLYVSKKSGLNDNLNGIEKPVSFTLGGEDFEIVHSLAKWKRWYLGELEAKVDEGLLTNMIAVRADEELSPIHSYLVDQWDWEKVISKNERSLKTLIKCGTSVFEALKNVEKSESDHQKLLPDELTILHSEDLYQMYPELTAKEREDKAAEEFGALLLLGIGGKLSNGKAHDLRAPDYDDWSTESKDGKPGLNADLIVWDASRQLSLEISSMGIRVDDKALERQLKLLGLEERMSLPFHKKILNKELPLTIGGGIGQSRVAMFITGQNKIEKVQPISMI